MAERVDRESWREWLQTRNQEDIALIAFRVAARLLPLVRRSRVVTGRDDDRTFQLDLLLARAILSGAVLGKLPSDVVVRSAFRSAGTTAYAAASDTDSDAALFAGAVSDFAADAEVFAADALSYSDGHSAPMVDATLLDDAKALGALWPNGMPDHIAAAWSDLRSIWRAEAPSWEFWIDWYEGLLEGREPDWPLWRDIALIKNEV